MKPLHVVLLALCSSYKTYCVYSSANVSIKDYIHTIQLNVQEKSLKKVMKSRQT